MRIPALTLEIQFARLDAVPALTTTTGTLTLELGLPVVMEPGDCGALTSSMGRLQTYTQHDRVQTAKQGSIGFANNDCNDKNQSSNIYSGNGQYRHVEALYVCDSSYHKFGRISVDLVRSGDALARETIDVLHSIGNPDHQWVNRSVSDIYACMVTSTESSHPILNGTTAGHTAEGLAHQGSASIYTFVPLSGFANSGFGGHAPSNLCAIGALWLETTGENVQVDIQGSISRGINRGVGDRDCETGFSTSARTTHVCAGITAPIYLQTSNPLELKTDVTRDVLVTVAFRWSSNGSDLALSLSSN